jgi:cytidine deaminase
MTNDELIAMAAGVLNPHTTADGRVFGDVAAALVTDRGTVYCGVCIDTTSGTGFCAEHAAIAAMVTAGEYRIARIVAVWRDDRNGELRVVPPCGRCREFMCQVDEANLGTEVVLGTTKVLTLQELLPHHEWPDSLASR